MKKKITFLILIIVFVAIGFGVTRYSAKSEPPTSYIDEQISKYVETGKWDEGEIPSVFSDDSAEMLFSKGMKHYANKDFEQSEQFFKEAKQKPSSDAALPGYLNIYLNNCAIEKNGTGNITYVKEALEAITKYPALSNHSYWIWNLVYSVIGNDESDISAQKLLKQYIEDAKELPEDEILLMETYRAILKNINGEYSESIMLFYEVLNNAQDMPESYNVRKSKINCINYIGDMYYTYEDYERANQLYQELIRLNIEDPYENAKLKYSAYINLGNIYLKQENYDQAKNIVSEIGTILPYLPEDIAAEINAFLYNILANIELEQGNLAGAIRYFMECQSFLQIHEGRAFFDTNVYFGLTQCKILKQSGDLKQAENILTQLLSGTIVETKMKYEVREMLADVYLATNQTDKYYQELELLLKEQNDRIKQSRADYCELISYYEQLLDLRKEHSISVQRNERLIAVLLVALMLLGIIIKLSLSRYRDSITDALSGLYNRKKLDKEFISFDKNKHKLMSYGVIMTDIDYFKKYNDTYGHVAGDNVIRAISKIIKQSVRDADIVIRYGGEEILVLLKDINCSTIESIAERIRINIENAQIPHKASECNNHVTMSLGGFYVEHPSQISLPDAIKEADKALYESKQKGKNTVTVF